MYNVRCTVCAVYEVTNQYTTQFIHTKQQKRTHAKLFRIIMVQWQLCIDVPHTAFDNLWHTSIFSLNNNKNNNNNASLHTHNQPKEANFLYNFIHLVAWINKIVKIANGKFSKAICSLCMYRCTLRHDYWNHFHTLSHTHTTFNTKIYKMIIFRYIILWLCHCEMQFSQLQLMLKPKTNQFNVIARG